MEPYEYHDYDSLRLEKDIEREDTRPRCKECDDLLRDFEDDYCSHCLIHGLADLKDQNQTTNNNCDRVNLSRSMIA